MNQNKRSAAEASDKNLNLDADSVTSSQATESLQANRRPIAFLISMVLFGSWLVYLGYLCLRVLRP